jgi:3-deoxy-7-phosphoheptulonate synthase
MNWTTAESKKFGKKILNSRPLIPPQILIEEIPLSVKAENTVRQARLEVERIVKQVDDRLLVIVGPCSIHDVSAAKEYAQRLAKIAQELKEDICVVMRVYFEKPRTTVGIMNLSERMEGIDK